MKNYLILLMLFAVCSQFSCSSSEPKSEIAETTDSEATDPESTATGDIDYDEMAQEFCTCMRPLYEFHEKVMQLVADGKQEEVEALSDEAEQTQLTAQSCAEAVENKHGIVEGEDQEIKATEALERACPDIMEMLSGGDSLEE